MWKRINLVASVFLCFFPSAVLAQAAYRITDLGTLSPTAINTWAQVAGNYNNQAYIWTFGRSRSLGIIPEEHSVTPLQSTIWGLLLVLRMDPGRSHRSSEGPPSSVAI